MSKETYYTEPFTNNKNADSLVIWHRNGDIGLFEKVKNFHVTGTKITFKYHGKSTNTDREATFFLDAISGHALSMEE